MTAFLLYLLKANVILCLLYGFYCIFLRRDTFHGNIRRYMLITLAATIIFPLIDLPDRPIRNMAPPPIAQSSVDTEEIYRLLLVLPATEPDSEEIATPPPVARLSPVLLLVWCLLAGTAFLFIRRLLQSITLLRFASRYPKQHYGDQLFTAIDRNMQPFSFFGHIFLNPSLYAEEELAEIIAHEHIHCRQMHTFDILFAEAVVCLCWFNPAVWLLRNDLKQNLEYYVDRRVLQAGFDRKHYQYNLLRASGSAYPVVNHFHFNHLKKRIVMMNKKNSPRFLSFKYAAIVPVLAAALWITQVSAIEVPSASDFTTGENAIDASASSIITPEQGSKPIEIKKHPANLVATNDSTAPSIPDQDKSIPDMIAELQNAQKRPLVFLDHAIISDSAFKAVDPQTIASVTTSDEENIAGFYGKGNSVILLISKEYIKKYPPVNFNDPNASLVIVDGKEEFPGILKTMDPNTIESISVLKNQSATALYGDKAANGVILVTTKSQEKINLLSGFNSYKRNEPLIIVNGVETPSLSGIDPNTIQMIEVRKDGSATALYGEKAANGVVIITLKDGLEPIRYNTIPDYRTRQGVPSKKDGENTGVSKDRSSLRKQMQADSVIINQKLTGSGIKQTKSLSKANNQILLSEKTWITDRTGTYAKGKTTVVYEGSKDPLYILDGEVVDSFENLTRSDIKSFSVVKDQSAIDKYGKKAKNGVIIVSTKEQ